jgi:hypothetical protein
MSDQELRDKLANEHLWVIPAHFIEGWDAARANDGRTEDLELHKESIETIKQLLKERDQLRAEVERLHKVIANEWMPILAAAEKLAEALEFVRGNLGVIQSPPFPAPVAYAAGKAREALAEYRAKLPKEGK